MQGPLPFPLLPRRVQVWQAATQNQRGSSIGALSPRPALGWEEAHRCLAQATSCETMVRRVKASRGEIPEVLSFLVAWRSAACGRMLEEGCEEELLGWLLLLLAGQVKELVRVQMEGEVRSVTGAAPFRSLGE